MKFVLAYTWRDGGSAAEREQTMKRSMQLLGKFSPSDPTQIKEWVDRVDYAPVGEGRQVGQYPVVDIGDAMPAQQEALDFLDSVS